MPVLVQAYLDITSRALFRFFMADTRFYGVLFGFGTT